MFDSVSDPYSAMAELLAAKAEFPGVVLSLQSLYREEIAMVRTLKRRLPHLEVWLAHTDNRQAALAEAMRFGADGLLGDEGLHRIAAPTSLNRKLPCRSPGRRFSSRNRRPNRNRRRMRIFNKMTPASVSPF